ncbi:MAG: hypothetical protein B6A08_17145 [Sorangiineae bacterium NIC37A_2]|jgi:hypothetical protein|nr:MAG: hypothetical protein B6A08_17145 [Sorangiineae bacterium NIC37A_2]
MAKLNIFIDGSWLFKACGKGSALSNRTEGAGPFRLDFERLCNALLAHAARANPNCTTIGERYLSTSILDIPADVEDWIDGTTIFDEDIQALRSSVHARDRFAQSALDANFDPSAIYRPKLRDWMLPKLRDRRFQEKLVDATVVALLVRSAIVNAGDYHVVLTGDADVLPAIRVAYPKYSENVFVATTHPDQLKSEARQSAFALHDFSSNVEPFYLDEHAAEFVDGDHVYTCSHCNKVFARSAPIPARARPCCSPCHNSRT